MLFKVIAIAAAIGLATAQTAVIVPEVGQVRFSSSIVPGTGQYGHNLNVAWRVTGPAGSGIEFNAEAFSLEAGTYDTLKFTEVVNGQNVQIGPAFSGNSGPSGLVSQTNSVLVTFKTDSSVASTGFRIAAGKPVCVSGQGLCPGSETQCIRPNQYCDGQVDCDNGADEHEYCNAECGHAPKKPNLNLGARQQLLAAISKRKDHGRIVGGAVAVPNSWPWQVAMLSSSGQQICGGSILNSQFIMTAAHCCVAYGANPSASTFKVRVGAHNIAANEPNARTLSLSKVIVHPSYASRPAAQNDFCLLRLAEPLAFNTDVQAVCLPSEQGHDEAPGTKCWVTGWGSTSPNRGSFDDFMAEVRQTESGKLPKSPKSVVRATAALYQVAVNITTPAACSAAYAPINITPQMICGAAPGKDSCQGDSGGPFVCQAGPDQPFKLVGVVSWGIGCARPSHPGVYARTSTAIDWINGELVKP